MDLNNSIYSGPDVSDAYSKLGTAGKTKAREAELEYGITASERAQSEANKRAQSEIMSEYGPALFSKPAPHFTPSQEDMSGFAALGSLLAVSGAMLGSKGKTAGIMAMNSISGMMKGYQAGRKDLYEQERQKFEESMKEWERDRSQVKEAFDLALKMAPTNYRGAVDFLNKTLTSLGVTVPKAMVGTSGPTYAAGVILPALDKAKATADSISQRTGMSGLEAKRRELAALKGIEAGQTAEAAQSKEGLEEQYKKAQIAELQKKATAEPALDVGPYAKTIISQQPLEKQKETTEFLAGKKTLDAKEKDRLDTAKIMMDESERVARYIAENPDAAGMLGQALGRSESVLGFFRGPPKSMDELESKIDNGLDSISKADPSQRVTAQKAAKLNKMLASLSLKDASATGRPTVFLERMISRWYNQGYPPDTLLDIIKERAGEADSVLSNYKLDTSRNTPDVNKEKYPLASNNVDDFLKKFRTQSTTSGLKKLTPDQITGIQQKINQARSASDLSPEKKKEVLDNIKKQISDKNFSMEGLNWGE